MRQYVLARPAHLVPGAYAFLRKYRLQLGIPDPGVPTETNYSKSGTISSKGTTLA